LVSAVVTAVVVCAVGGEIVPQAVIIGGGICNEGEYLLQPLRRWVGERIYVDGETIPLVIARAKLGNDAGIYGAAALAMGR